MMKRSLVVAAVCASVMCPGSAHAAQKDLLELPLSFKPCKLKGSVTVLTQSDFDAGTLVITQPGKYCLGEDISFCPKNGVEAPSESEPELWMFPDRSVSPYDNAAYRLGNFAAIVIAAKKVTLDLGGFTLEQCEEHALMQRFFALIELSSSPFPGNKGPASFGSEVISARKVQVTNGRLGRSSHHGIHGNSNVDVRLANLEVTDFEVAGVSLNAVSDLVMRNVHIHHTRTDVPANGRLSQTVFLLQAVSLHLGAGGSAIPAALLAARDELRAALYAFITAGTDTDTGLFATETGGMPDASMAAGVVLNGIFSVGDFQSAPGETRGHNIKLQRVVVEDISVSPGEIGAVVPIAAATAAAAGPAPTGYSSDAAHDIVGAIFDVDYVVDAGAGHVYRASPLADLQLAIAAYAIDCDGTCADAGLLKRSTIPQQLVDWAAGELTWAALLEEYEVVGGHDVMFHFVKGAVGIKLDGSSKAKFEDVAVRRVANVADASRRSPLAAVGAAGHNYEGFSARGLSIAESSKVATWNVHIDDLKAASSRIRCVDVMNTCSAVSLGHVNTGHSES